MIYNEQLKKRSGKQLISPIKDANITDLESFTRYERVPTTIFYDMVDAAKIVAKEIATIIKVKELMGENCVIGLVTGVTPVMVYHELVRMHKEENLSFRNVVTFNTYEFCTFEAGLPQHCMQYLNDHLFNHVDIKRENIFFIDGSVPREKTKEICQSYELEIERQGGIDLLLLGIGRMGHISFNEPGSSRNSTTRLVTLSRSILYESNQYTDSQNMPRKAITIGIATIMKAKKILLLAVGDEKTTVVKEAIEGRVNDSIPASFLQEHPKVKFVLDEAAASDLTRIKTPWLIDACEWDDRLIRKGVIWLCQKLNKPILKLTDKDYNDNGMNDLITLMESAYKINIKVFNDLQHTITGWPGGKPNADDTNRPERALPFPKKIFIFSPHPDDDVISMGGTFLRLVEQGHDVHVAYHVSGSIAVADDETLRFSSFVTNFKQIFNIDNEVVDELYRKVEAFINTKKSGQIDIHEVREIKALIRRGEALAACRFVGISEENVHFLNMPFYETGKSKKSSLSDVDIQIIAPKAST